MNNRNRLLPLFITWFLLLTVAIPVFAQRPDISKLTVDPTQVSSARELVQKSTLIVYGTTQATTQSYPTGKTVEGRRVINFVQPFHVKRTLKGPAVQTIRLLTVGVGPLPDRNNPLNDRYPGPFAVGEEFVLFLQSIPSTNLYSTIGLWQGVYPVYAGRTVSLERYGYPELGNLTMGQMTDKMRVLGRAR